MKTKEDFLTDPEFIRWIKDSDKELDAYWNTWIKANRDQLPSLRLAKEILLRVKYEDKKPARETKEEILNNILKEIPDVPEIIVKTGTPDPKRHWLWMRMGQFQRTAAVLLVSLALGWLMLFFIDSAPTDNYIAEEIKMIRKMTVPGEKLQVTLPDGTRVWMNSASELEFPEKFDSLERIVRIAGEIYFEVEKDTLRPFKVVSDGLVTTVLGTSFNINTKKPDRISVSLLTGKVSVRAPESSQDVHLEAGEALDYHIEKQENKVKRFDPNEVIGWRDGWILFRRASLKEVVKKLEDWYGVRIRLVNAFDIDWQLSAEYQNQALEDVLKSLSYIQDFEFTIKGKEVEFKF